MIRFALSTLLIGAVLTTHADATPQRSVFSYSKEVGLSGQLRAVQDLVILRDGSLLQGELSSVPSLKFTFGSVELPPEEISMLSTVEGVSPMLKIVMRSGEVYAGTPEHFTVTFVEKQRGDVSVNLNLNEVDSILVKPRTKRENPFIMDSLHVSLRNGEQFPVQIADRYIELSDGWSVKRIERHQVVDLYFNGGLFGTIANDQGEEELPLSFVKQQSIRFVAPVGNHHIQVPWKQIAQLSKSTDHCVVEEQMTIVQESKEEAPKRFTAAHPEDTIHEVEFLQEPIPIFANGDRLEIPEGIVFVEEPKPLFDQKDLDDLEKMFAVGEDFDFDDLGESTTSEQEEENDFDFISRCQGTAHGICLAVGEDFDLDDLETTVEEANSEDEDVEFLSCRGADIASMLAVGEDFDLDEMDETVDQKGEEEEDFEFLSYLDRMMSVGEDFDLNEPDETVKGQEEEAIEFVTHEEMKAVSEQPVAYRGCPCIQTGNAKQMPHVDFSMDDGEADAELIMAEEEVPDIDWSKIAKPAIPEVPYQNGRRREVEKQTMPSRLEFSSSLSPSVIASAPSREFDGLIYVPAGHADGSGFYIKPDKVTNREYKKFVDAINYRTPLHWVGDTIPKGMEDEPVVNVSYRDAFLYSVWAGKRLPTEEELIRAVEADTVLKNPENQTAEWTSTPTLRSVRYPQSGTSVKIGQHFSPSHQVFSRYRIVSMNNDDSNNYTGFRTAIDGH